MAIHPGELPFITRAAALPGSGEPRFSLHASELRRHRAFGGCRIVASDPRGVHGGHEPINKRSRQHEQPGGEDQKEKRNQDEKSERDSAKERFHGSTDLS